MKHLLLLIVLFQSFNSYFCDKLIAVTALVNHGDTIPNKFYPNDPNQGVWSKNALGQLSNLGKQQSYAIGLWLRRRYITKTPFITLHYNATQIFTFSEDRDESLMSAECIMAGFFPPVGDEIWIRGIHWRPTPVHTAPVFLDRIIGRGVFCPTFNKELQKVRHGRFVRTLNRSDKNLLQFLTETTGENFTNINQIPRLFNVLNVEEAHGLSLPEWTQSIYPGILSQVVLESSILRTKNALLTKLSVGPFFNELLYQWSGIIEKSPHIGSASGDLRKFKLYVSNDTLFYDVLNALNVSPSVGIVKPAAALVFELWKNEETGAFNVRALFKSSSEKGDSPQPIKIGNCKSFKCNYGKMEGILENYSLNSTQWNQTCFNDHIVLG